MQTNRIRSGCTSFSAIPPNLVHAQCKSQINDVDKGNTTRSTIRHLIVNSCVIDRPVIELFLAYRKRGLQFQAASPFLLLHLPFYVSILGPLFEARTGEASNYFPFLFAWCPAINPILTLCIVTDFRQFVVSVLKRKWLKTPSATVLRSNIHFGAGARRIIS
ncbi:unnamed protein product [Haemonchus placei]|uniref:G protein-coupled receptor n=1 Tax=Haemonchus placei TaxID=6290 RepID=A0A0N4WU11_HAEPC|nr:unnamed protein product [Haemonchus placei]